MIGAERDALQALLQRLAPLPARLALVGGAVRDLLLHRHHDHPWTGLPDLDLVVDQAWPGAPDSPPAFRLLEGLAGAETLAGCRRHPKFGTLELQWAGVWLDVASARRETYPISAGNPQVQFASLEDDLSRRDFTVNAMALVHGPGGLAEPVLFDPHGGRADLAARRLHFLHGASVRDDPTRVIRGARYAARLGFTLSDGARDQVAETLAAWPWPWRPGDDPQLAPPALATRLRLELELLLGHDCWRQALAQLQAWGGLALLDAGLQRDSLWPRRMGWAQRLGLPPLAALLAGATDPLSVAERLQLPHRQQRLLQEWHHLRQRLAAAPSKPTTVVAWCALLEAPGCSPEAVALAIASGQGPRRPLLRWWLRWRTITAPQTAQQLMAAGCPAGPALGERLQQLRSAALQHERP